MNRKIINSIFVLLIFSFTSPAQISTGGGFSLEKSVIASGGESVGGALRENLDGRRLAAEGLYRTAGESPTRLSRRARARPARRRLRNALRLAFYR